MRKPIGTIAIAALIAVRGAAAADGDAPRYAVVFDAGTQQAQVRLCLREAHATIAFAADSAWAKRFISDVARADGKAVDTGSAGWRASDWRAGECLSYRADIGAIAQQHEPDVGWKIGDDLVAAPQLWLLRPDAQGDSDADLHIELPAAWNLSSPWRELDRAGTSIHFSIPNTPADWSSAVAFGKFAEERIALPGGVLRLTILHDADAAQHAKLRAWLDRVAKAALSAYGRLPLPEVQVLMIPVGAGRGAVMFGQSVRGQGNALELLIDPARPASEFDDDWMAVHELSHLMHPYLGDRGSWLAEGLATYYQNVLRARAGLLTPAQAWDRLHEGFQRGAKAAGGDTLEDVASDMHHSHQFQRVYWAGAAYWLAVDRELRRAGTSLDAALSRFRDCCLPAYRQWRPEDFVARLDALAATDAFSRHYGEFAKMRTFPDWEKVFADLGVHDGGEHLSFSADAPDASIRDAIMAPHRGDRSAVAGGRGQ